MKLACLYSGGKDSTFAIWYALNQGHSVHLVSVFPEPESLMFHVPNLHLAPLSAESMGLPLSSIETTHKKELADLESLLSSLDIEGVVSGALASDFQKTRIERICDSLSLKSFTPLWHIDPNAYLTSLLDGGFRTIFTSVSSDGLDQSWLGRELDQKAVRDLKKLDLHIAGEGGEYETLVLDAPIFRKKLSIRSSEKTWEGASGLLTLKAVLEDKP